MDKPDNSGALFRNDRKEKDTQPDYTGECRIEGVEYRLSAWLNESKNGKKYMGLKLTAKDDMPGQQAPTADPPKDFDDEMPFS